MNTLAQLLALPGFRPDLEGARKRGSTTEQALQTLPGSTPVSEFFPSKELTVPGARYFEFEASSLGGRLGAISFAEAAGNPITKVLLRCRDAGEHGVDFYLDCDPEEDELPPAPIGIAILGPLDDKGTFGWWTWYVATETTKVLGTSMARGKATNTPVALCAVKLHNGE